MSGKLRSSVEGDVVSELLKYAMACFTFQLHLNDLSLFVRKQGTTASCSNEFRSPESAVRPSKNGTPGVAYREGIGLSC